jgi:hypothetical protein
MKNKKPRFEYDKETGISICELTSKYGMFVGEAYCHPDDMDMESEKVGCEIAYCRATIEAFKYERDYVIKPSLKALRQLYYSMKHSNKFNPKSYEAKMLWRQIQNWQMDLDTVNNILATERQMLTDYIKTKEALYQNIRAQRNKGQN